MPAGPPPWSFTEWNHRGQPKTSARRKSRLISVRGFEFFQPLAVLAEARYCSAATAYSLLSPKISCVLSSDWSDLFLQPGTSWEDREKPGNR